MSHNNQDEAAIKDQIAKIAEGLRDKDLQVLRRIYAPDVVSFDIDPPMQHVGIAAKLANWEKAFAFFQTMSYEVRDLAVTLGDAVAYAHGFGRVSGTHRDGTATNGTWVRATYCFRKIDDRWLIAHDHVSVPLDYASGRGATDLEP